MKPSRWRVLFTTLIGRWFLAFWLGAVALTVLRCAFDLDVYLNGAMFVRRDKSSDYLLHLPCGYIDVDRRRPLLIYLHGAGERFADVRDLKTADIVHYIDGRIPPEKFPFIVVSPKSSPYGWEPEAVIKLIDELLADDGSRLRVDPSRIYITGFSMGGYGVWETMQRYPERFVAAVPLAGGCRSFDPGVFRDASVWAFHGELDDVIDCECSLAPMEALWQTYPELRDRFRLTVYPDLDHGIPRRVYGDIELYRWMLRQRYD